MYTGILQQNSHCLRRVNNRTFIQQVNLTTTTTNCFLSFGSFALFCSDAGNIPATLAALAKLRTSECFSRALYFNTTENTCKVWFWLSIDRGCVQKLPVSCHIFIKHCIRSWIVKPKEGKCQKWSCTGWTSHLRLASKAVSLIVIHNNNNEQSLTYNMINF